MKSILTRMYATLIELTVGLVFGYLIMQKASVVIYTFVRSISRSVRY